MLEYVADYTEFLVAAPVPEEAAVVDERHTRITDIWTDPR